MVNINNMRYNCDYYTGMMYEFDVETDEIDVVQWITNRDWRVGRNNMNNVPKIEDVIFNDPATIVKWADGSKTIVKTDDRYGDEYNPEMGLAMCICKKALGNKGNFNEVFRKWVWDNPRLK